MVLLKHHGFLFLPFHLFLSSAGVARVLCRAQETASPHTDDLQLHLLRVGESVVLPADAVQHERGLHERPSDGRVSGAEEAICHDLHRLRPCDPRLLQILQFRA